jgi:integral membrane protein
MGIASLNPSYNAKSSPPMFNQRPRMLKTSIGRLRAIGLVEGVSFLLLLGVAMPLKYFAGVPQAVTIIGWLHGMLFITFCIALAQARQEANWNARRTGVVLLAGLLPFGPFVIDSRLRKEDQAPQKTAEPQPIL